MAILANEKVLTLDYWKPAYKLQPGDYVFNKDGKPVKVKLVQEYRAETCYQVHFNDHLTVAGDQNLGFLAENKVYRIRVSKYKGVNKFRRPLKFTQVGSLVGVDLKNHDNRTLYSVPTAKPLEFPHQDLPVEPFIFGFWFLNLRSTKNMAAPRGTAKFVEEKFKNCGYKLTYGKKVNTGERTFTVYPTIESQLIPNIPNKIPTNYLLASAEQRTELLRGILYAKSRQYCKKRDRFRITSFNKTFILQVQQLVESLGHRTSLEFNDQIRNYTLFFKSRLKLVEHQNSPPLKVHHGRRFIKQVQPIVGQNCVHIETESEDKSFLVGEGFIPCR